MSPDFKLFLKMLAVMAILCTAFYFEGYALGRKIGYTQAIIDVGHGDAIVSGYNFHVDGTEPHRITWRNSTNTGDCYVEIK